jgi:hypothetical protein
MSLTELAEVVSFTELVWREGSARALDTHTDVACE